MAWKQYWSSIPTQSAQHVGQRHEQSWMWTCSAMQQTFMHACELYCKVSCTWSHNITLLDGWSAALHTGALGVLVPHQWGQSTWRAGRHSPAAPVWHAQPWRQTRGQLADVSLLLHCFTDKNHRFVAMPLTSTCCWQMHCFCPLSCCQVTLACLHW